MIAGAQAHLFNQILCAMPFLRRSRLSEPSEGAESVCLGVLSPSGEQEHHKQPSFVLLLMVYEPFYIQCMKSFWVHGLPIEPLSMPEFKQHSSIGSLRPHKSAGAAAPWTAPSGLPIRVSDRRS